MTAATLSTQDVAQRLSTDPRTLRRFLRSRAEGVGTGKRYSIASESITSLKRDFAGWQKADADKRSKKSDS